MGTVVGLWLVAARTVEIGTCYIVKPATEDHRDGVGSLSAPELTYLKESKCFIWNCGKTIDVCRLSTYYTIRACQGEKPRLMPRRAQGFQFPIL